MMPGMDGRELARRYIAERPATRVLFMSGYAHDTADGTAPNARQPSGREPSELPATTLRKPFTTQELLRAIQAALTSGPVAR
jgi:CheY-like chemotaxis protein